MEKIKSMEGREGLPSGVKTQVAPLLVTFPELMCSMEVVAPFIVGPSYSLV